MLNNKFVKQGIENALLANFDNKLVWLHGGTDDIIIGCQRTRKCKPRFVYVFPKGLEGYYFSIMYTIRKRDVTLTCDLTNLCETMLMAVGVVMGVYILSDPQKERYIFLNLIGSKAVWPEIYKSYSWQFVKFFTPKLIKLLGCYPKGEVLTAHEFNLLAEECWDKRRRGEI